MNYIKVGNVYKDMNEDEVVNLTDYKHAKVHLENLEHILHVINLGIRALTYFVAYRTALNVVTFLRAEKVSLEGQVNKYRKLVKNKGKR